MLRNYPKLSVVIPTRQRADTLIYTLKTVTEQVYENLEIIVSDNASQDRTEEVVNAIQDHRIKYINTENRIGMSENWEHGLAYVTGDYVMFLGDDDGLLPNACIDVAELIMQTNANAIIWSKADYTWPSVSHYPNMLSLNCNKSLCKINGNILLRAISKGITSYGRLPVIYSGFVSVAGVNSIKSCSGNFFCSITPDVYSGIVLAHQLQSYIYSLRPFSINGGSHHSNGINSMKKNSLSAELFFSESKILIHEEFPIIKGSLQSCVAEAFAQAEKNKLLGSIKLDRTRIYKNLYRELVSQPYSIKMFGLKQLSSLKLPKKLRHKLNNEMALQSVSEQPVIKSIEKLPRDSMVLNGHLVIDCNKYAVKNAYDVCQLIGNILGPYQIPSIIVNANAFSFALTLISRILNRKLGKYILPF